VGLLVVSELSLWLGGGSARGADAKLASSSPFLPADGAVYGSMTGAKEPLELQGIMGTSTGELFAIYDVQRRSVEWVHLNEVGSGFVVQEYRTAGGVDQVRVQYRGASHVLVLKQARIAAASGAQSPRAVAAAPSSAGPNELPVLPGIPTEGLTPHERARLQVIAAEIKRRMAKSGSADDSGPR